MNNFHFSSADFSAFNAHLKSVLGLKDLDISIDLSGKKPEIICENLVANSGIFAATLSDVRPYIFNFDSSENNGEAYLWMTVYLSYQHKDGGTNGSKLFTAWYYTEETQHHNSGWVFKSVDSKY